MGNLCATFKLFSLEHFVYILLAIALSVGGVILFKKFEHRQRVISIIVVVVMVLFSILEYVGRIIGVTEFKLLEMLPINLVQIFTVISIIVVVKGKVSWEKFLYLTALPVSALSIIFIPNFYTTLTTFSLATISYVVVYVCVIVFSIMRMLWNKEDIYQKDVIDALITFVIIICAGHILNVIFRFTPSGVNADYFGTMAENYNMYIGWLSSLISIPFVCHLPLFALLVGVEYLLKLPFDVFKTRREHQEQMEELVALGNIKAQQRYREAQRKSGSQILIRNNDKQSTSASQSTMTQSKDSFIKSKSVDINEDSDK